MMTEDVYDALLQNWKKNKEMQQLIQKLIEKQQEMDQHIDTESGDSQPEGVSEVEGDGEKSEVSGRFKKTDAETTQKSKGEKEAQATNITNQAAQEAKRESSRGTGSGMPSELEIEIKAPSVNWKSVLRQFLSLGSKAYYNIKKPNKRALAAGYYAPKMERVYNKLDAVITLDTSGSISEGMIRTFVSEVVAIIKAAPNVRVLVIFWEAHAYSPLPGGEPFIIEASRMSIDQAEKNLKSLKISRGGTLLSSITSYYQKVKSTIPGFKPAVLITFTDGYIEEDPILPADIPFDKRVFLINNLSMSGQKTMAGDDSIVKKVGKHVMGVKVEG
jgi:predicted metal-dependent peptidase